MCGMAIAHNARLSSGYRFALTLLGGVRRWVFLPGLVNTVPLLVLFKGGDALSVCLNTVAMLFLCEIDNMIYKVGMAERTRTRVEEYARVELGDEEAAALVRSKQIHVGAVVVAVLAAVQVARPVSLIFFVFPAFWLGSVAEALVVPGATASGMAKGTLKATGAFVLGAAGFAVLVITS